MIGTDATCTTCDAASNAYGSGARDVEADGWVSITSGAVVDPAPWTTSQRLFRCTQCKRLWHAFFDPYNDYWELTPLPEAVARLLRRDARTEDAWPLIDKPQHHVRGIVQTWLSAGEVDVGEIANGLVARLGQAGDPDRAHELLVYLRLALTGESGGRLFRAIKAGGKPIQLHDAAVLTSLFDRTSLWRGAAASAVVEKAAREELRQIVHFGLGVGPYPMLPRVKVPDEDLRGLAESVSPEARPKAALREIEEATGRVGRDAVPVGGEPLPEGREAWGLPLADVAGLRAGLQEIVGHVREWRYHLSESDVRVLIAAATRLETLAAQSGERNDTASLMAKRYRWELEMFARNDALPPGVRAELAEFLSISLEDFRPARGLKGSHTG